RRPARASRREALAGEHATTLGSRSRKTGVSARGSSRGAMSRTQVRGRGARRFTAAFVVVAVGVTVLGATEVGARQNPPVDQPGVTDKTNRVGGGATEANAPTALTRESSLDGGPACCEFL